MLKNVVGACNDSKKKLGFFFCLAQNKSDHTDQAHCARGENQIKTTARYRQQLSNLPKKQKRRLYLQNG